MKKTENNIRQRKDGRFEGRLTIDGKTYSCYGKSVTEVKKKLKQLKQESQKGNVIAKNVRLDVALEEYLEKIKMGRVKATTYDRAESTFKYHIKNEPLGHMKIGTITNADIQKLLLDKCKTGLSKSSIKKIYNLLGEFFRYAAATRIIGYNPMELVQMPHDSKILHKTKEMELLETEEFKKVVAVAEQIDESGQPVYRYGEAIILLLSTGLRSCELRGLNISNIDIDSKVMTVCQSETYSKDRENGGIKHEIGNVKTEKSNRIIPLNDRAIRSIQRLLETTCNHETGYLVCTAAGKIVTHSNLCRCYNAILKKADVKHMGIHSTRHTFATVTLKNAENKGQIKEVSELLGHSQVNTTYQYYIKASVEDKRKLVNDLGTLIS